MQGLSVSGAIHPRFIRFGQIFGVCPHSLLLSGEGSGRSHMDFVKAGKLGIGNRVRCADAHRRKRGEWRLPDDVLCLGASRGQRGERNVARIVTRLFIARQGTIQCDPVGRLRKARLRIDPASFGSVDRARRLPADPLVPLSSTGMRARKEQLHLVAGSREFFRPCLRESEHRCARRGTARADDEPNASSEAANA